MTSDSLKGKTVIITGGSRGIGKAIAELFLKEQATVITFSRSGSGPSSSTNVRLDITNMKSVRDWFSKYRGSLDILINNAGIYPETSLEDATEKDWNLVFSVNAKALFFLSQLAAKKMKRGGIIINASSFATKLPSIGFGLYAASKATVEMLTRTMAAEWAKKGIRVNAYAPGVITTEMTKTRISARKSQLTAPIALSRFGSPDEVANVVRFLCSNNARYLTGNIIEVSGGKFLVQNQEES